MRGRGTSTIRDEFDKMEVLSSQIGTFFQKCNIETLKEASQASL